MSTDFEADLDPQTGNPRVRFNFPNGMSASLVLISPTADRCHFLVASLAACPTGQWGTGKTEIYGNELTAEEVAHWLTHIAMSGART